MTGLQTGLFSDGPARLSPDPARPLADRLRPANLADIVGQQHIVGPNGELTNLLKLPQLPSLILCGPPGVGKTSIARLVAAASGTVFVQLSALSSGVADLKRVFEEASHRRDTGQTTLLFVDEIHRFNRTQQDSFLAVVEQGRIILVGATTENPSFALNDALTSRCAVLLLRRLDDADMEALLCRAEAELGAPLRLTPDARAALRAMADGDGRYLLNMAERVAALAAAEALDEAALTALVGRRAALYDRDRDGHYNLISALHKSLRGSDTDAALYWFARMLEGGEDPRYIARRLVRFASEDVGLADPQALVQTLAAWEAYERLGSPEGDLALSQAVIYLGTAPKSNAAYKAHKAAARAAKKTGSLAPPPHILNAPTKLMKQWGHGEGYAYDHDEEDGFSGQNYFPDGIERAEYYQPADRGFERELGKRQAYWAELRAKKK